MSTEMEDQKLEEEAFAAEMADGTPPVEAEAEAAEVEHQEEPQRIEVIAGYTEDEIKAALEKVKETDALRADLAQVRKALDTQNGTYGNKLAQLQQSISEIGHSAEFSPEDFEDLGKNFDMPELTEAIVKGLNKKFKAAAKASDPSMSQSEIDRIVFERIKPFEDRIVETERRAETKALNRAHPDWADVAKSQDFARWAKETLAPQDLQDLNSTWDSDLVSRRLSEFKTHREKQTKAEKATQNRLEAAVVHRGIGGKQHKAAIDEEEEAFRKEMASGF